MREQNPFVFLPYVVKKKLSNHPHFKWIMKYVKNKDNTIQLFKAFIAKKRKSSKVPKFKFGIQVPHNSTQAYKIDDVNRDKLWSEAIDNEINSINEHETFIILEDDEPLPEGYKEIPYHLVFDAKFDGRRKARLVAGGHRAPDITREEAYSGVVSMETIRVAFVLDALNNLDVCAADISTAFLHGKTKEKVFVRAGKEFDIHHGKRMLIDKGLYGLQSSAARFHDKLASSLRKMNFKPCKADYDLWIRDKGDHYEYLAVYVDDLLVFSRDPMSIIETIRNEYDLKGVGIPEYYLGGDIDMMTSHATTKDVIGTQEAGNDEKDIHLDVQWIKQGIKTAFSARTYIRNTVERLERMMDRKFPSPNTPMSETLHPEIDASPYLDDDGHHKFQSMVGSANWLITLGRFDIAYSVNTFSRHSMQPRQGHLIGMIRVFGYLNKFWKGRILVDPNYPKHSVYPTPECDNWKEFYPDAEEHVPDPSETPKP